MRQRPLICLVAAVLLGVSAPTFAQRFTASIRGTVTDESGGTVSGAKVSVVGTDTGLARETVTNAAGAYSFGELPVGLYLVSVEKEGFSTAVVSDIQLNVADTRAVDVQLAVGAITEEITTTASAIVVETIGGEVAGLVTGEQVRELPLNGRNFAQLTQLMPGVSTPDSLNFKNKGLLGGVDMSVSGSSVTGNAWLVDGANNNDSGSNRTILVYPSVDAIEEFKIHRNSYGPEFGGAGGAQVNLVTRGGTNEFKGSVYAFYRNDSLNETNYFLEQAGADKEKIDRKDYGFTFGGPLKRDKLHFFVSQEWNDEERGVVKTGVVPTAAERSGDFSTFIPGCSQPTPTDPLTGLPFPGNVIPANRLSDAGLGYMQLYPLPNTTPSAGSCNNWVASVPTAIDWRQTNGRLDWNVTDKVRTLLRYTEDSWQNPQPNAGAANGLWGDDPFPAVDSSWDQPGDSLVAQLNQVIGNSVVNTFTFSKSGNEINITRSGDADTLNAQLNTLVPSTFPADGKENGNDHSHAVYWGGATGADMWTIAPWQNSLDHMTFKDDYEQVFGDHVLKAGVLYDESEKSENLGGASAFEAPHFWGGAGIGGWGATSGNRIADILIRDMYHGFDETAFEPTPTVAWQDLEAYVGDSWQFRPNLTLDFGIRYSRLKEPYALDDNIVAFYPELFDPALGNAPCNGIAQVPGTNPCAERGLVGGGTGASRSFVQADTDNFAPRAGVAWDVFGTGKSVLRAGFGQFFQRERVSIQVDFAGQPPFTRNTSGIRPLDRSDPTNLAPGFGVPNRGIDKNNQTPYNIQYNLTWEQQLGANSTLEVSYVGNRGRHLLTKGDINQVRRGDNNGNGVEDRLEYIRGGGDGNGAVRPYFTGGANRILFWRTNGKSEYDGLQTQYQLRFGNGSQLQISYTYSDFKANTSVLSSSAGEEAAQATDWEDLDLDWGPADLDREHILNSSVVWNLPTFEGRGGLVEYLLGNWTIGGVLSYASGTPITVYAANISGLGGSGFLGTGYDDNNRPIQIGSCGGGHGAQFINPNAFTLNGLRLGDTSQMAGRGVCEGPDFFQMDLAFYKSIRFGGRVSGQLRFEVFNLTDEANFIANSGFRNTITPSNVVLDAPLGQATQIVSATIPGGFGEATAARDPRQIQIGFKLFF